MNEFLNTKENVTEEQTPYMITRKIGGMTYDVELHFNIKKNLLFYLKLR